MDSTDPDAPDAAASTGSGLGCLVTGLAFVATVLGILIAIVAVWNVHANKALYLTVTDDHGASLPYARDGALTLWELPPSAGVKMPVLFALLTVPGLVAITIALVGRRRGRGSGAAPLAALAFSVVAVIGGLAVWQQPLSVSARACLDPSGHHDPRRCEVQADSFGLSPFGSFDEWDQVEVPEDYAGAVDGATRWIDGWAAATVLVGLMTGGAAIWLLRGPIAAASAAGGSA